MSSSTSTFGMVALALMVSHRPINPICLTLDSQPLALVVGYDAVVLCCWPTACPSRESRKLRHSRKDWDLYCSTLHYK